VYRRAAACVVLCHEFGEILVSGYGVKRGRVHVIPPGFDPVPFAIEGSRLEARRRLGLADVPTALSVRRLVPRMGLDIGIRSIAALSPELVGRYLIAGTGPERPRLEALAAELGILDRVAFLGRVPDADLPWLYAAADFTLVPTRELEGFGYVALESLAAGTPVIATSNGGLVDLVGALEPRWLTQARPDAIAEAVRSLLAGRADTPDRAACRAYAGTFAWSEIAPRIVELFQHVSAHK
jgi:glycosyltransferase involved in cell wall biosynthesis